MSFSFLDLIPEKIRNQKSYYADVIPSLPLVDSPLMGKHYGMAAGRTDAMYDEDDIQYSFTKLFARMFGVMPSVIDFELDETPKVGNDFIHGPLSNYFDLVHYNGSRLISNKYFFQKFGRKFKKGAAFLDVVDDLQDVIFLFKIEGEEENAPLMVHARYLGQEENAINILFTEKTERHARELYGYLMQLYALPRRDFGKKDPVISFIVKNSHGGFELATSKLNLPKNNEIEFFDNYNDSFKTFYKKVLGAFEQKTHPKGIALMHGIPGSGKTSTIRKFCLDLAGKRDVLYLSNSMTEHLADPALITFFRNYPGRILVIEDAETVLRKRTDSKYASAAVTNLLNISDGILSDILDMQIIATFNCEVQEIDEAFLRKGRLISSYEFGYLDESKIDNILTKKDISWDKIVPHLELKEGQTKKELTLADIHAAITSFENQLALENND